MVHTIRVTAWYKMGRQMFNTRKVIIARNIDSIEEVPEEIPEHQDGCLTRINLSNGLTIFAKEKFEDVVTLWEIALNNSL